MATEAGTSYYLFTMQGEPFDLLGFDIESLEGAGELVSSSGEKLVFSSFDPEIGRLNPYRPSKQYRFPPSASGWKGITWFRFQDAGGSAVIDNVKFEPVSGQEDD